MCTSRLDKFYRGVLLSKYFVKGWGDPEGMIKLLKFRKVLSNRESCYKLVEPTYPVTITNTDTKGCLKIIDGYFHSPFDKFLPGLLPEESKKAYFQAIIPNTWNDESYKPVCLHMAGTGDHYFWRRRKFMAKPLLKEDGIGAIILENPFYGLRKPKYQMRSVLHNVSDIFVMGGCLILEALVLFHWSQRNGFGPLGVTGLSMGGHMASLAATNWPEPLVLVPCLSWSTASGVFTKGVMSHAINWEMLASQYKQNEMFRREIRKMCKSPDEITEAFKAGQKFAQDFPRNIGDIVGESHSGINSNNITSTVLCESIEKDKFMVQNQKSIYSTNRSFLDIMRDKLSLKDFSLFYNGKKDIVYHWNRRFEDILVEETVSFMRGIMDECTHLRNFSVPVDTSLIICVYAQNDGYVPRDGVTDIKVIWPGANVRLLNAGHVSAFVLYLSVFRSAIVDAFAVYKKKYC